MAFYKIKDTTMLTRFSYLQIAATLCLTLDALNAEQLLVHTPSSDDFVVHYQPHEEFSDVLARINSRLDTPSDGSDLSFEVADAQYPQSKSAIQKSIAKAANKVVRNYKIPATKTEQEIVQYIVITMANKSPAKIWKERNSLKKSGDKLDHLHPFRFLLAIFTHEEAKAAVASLKGNNWVYGYFKEGLYTSLTEEHEKHNLKVEHVNDFAAQLGIDGQIILPSIKSCDWDELVTLLIKHVPREGNPTRYNM
jgi:hypothetical protein